MDPVDLRIIASLDRDARKSYAQIASELGITSRLVQRRVAKMMRSGFIRGFDVIFDTSLVGLGEATCDAYLRGKTSIEEVRNNLLKYPAISQILTLLGGTLVVRILYQNRIELEQTLSQIAGIQGIDDIKYEIAPFASTRQAVVSRNDLQIIRALNHHARAEFAPLAKKLEMSSKTIKRRVSWLVRQGVIRFGVDIDVSKAQDLFLYVLVIQLARGASKDHALHAIKKRIASVWRELRSINPFTITLSLYAERLSDLERDAEAARNLDDVAGLSVAFITAEHRNDSRLDNLIRKIIP
jgi:DNA-binding Lrp family transcriptional regulator